MWHFATAHHMYQKMVLQKVETSPVLCEMPCGRTTGKFRQRDLTVQLIVWVRAPAAGRARAAVRRAHL